VIALEMNLSCPNIKKGGISFGKEANTVYDIIKKTKEITTIPLIAKLTPEVKNIVEIAIAAYEGGADGLTILNTIPAAVVDVKRGNIPIKGGLSGPLLKPIALKAVHEVSRAVPIPVIGVGGIMDYRDAIAFFMAGAKAIQVGTATFVDPYTIPKIIRGMQGYLQEHKLSRIEKIIGVTHC
jgi:dihydroorotate dehydrogenase (NAD+) catalytic subunit